MSIVEEVLETISSLEKTLDGYMDYDGMVGGLVSQSIKALGEMKELLKKPTKKNIQEALKMVRAIKERIAPYSGQAPDVDSRINLLEAKLQAL